MKAWSLLLNANQPFEGYSFDYSPMASLSTTLKPLSLFSPFLQEPPKHSPKTLFTYTPNKNCSQNCTLSRSVVPHKKRTFTVADTRDLEVENYRRIPFSDVVVVGKERAFWKRRWSYWDITRAVVLSGFHLLSLLAPFHFNWAAFRVAVGLSLVAGIGITLSYHRNLSHRSFKLPKWLEYFFAYCGNLALQGDPIEWVSNHRYHHQHSDTQRDPHSPTQGFWFSHVAWVFDTDYIVEKCGGHDNVADLTKQPFYRFLQRTKPLHNVALALLLHLWGGLPFLAWGMGVRSVLVYHTTFLVNSVCHIWGKQAWNTCDLSKNNWWVAMLTFGEGWHNNHHAFEFSARHGLEWWQLDITWGIIWFLQAIGLATDVKLPTEVQKQRMVFHK